MNALLMLYHIHISTVMVSLILLLGYTVLIFYMFCKDLKFQSPDKPWDTSLMILEKLYPFFNPQLNVL